jgi:GNAT superfamily N-acetyltransferase
MVIEVRAATDAAAVLTLVGAKSPTARVCTCLSYRLPSRERRELDAAGAAAVIRSWCAAEPAPGVVAWDGDEPVGWAAVHPRRETTFARSRVIPHLDDLDVWSVWCFRVAPGHKRRGIMHHLLDGALRFAADSGAPAIEGYPLDNGGARIEQTMAYVGTLALFEQHGFTRAAETASVLDGHPRVIARRVLA